MTIDLIKRHTGLPGPEAVGSNSALRTEEAYPLDDDTLRALPESQSAAINAALARRPDASAWVLETRALEAAGWLRGDVVIVDKAATPTAGDPVCALVVNPRNGAQEKLFRLYEPPYLVPASYDPELRRPMLVDNDAVRLFGAITDTFRTRK